jgi:hypothetical protein
MVSRSLLIAAGAGLSLLISSASLGAPVIGGAGIAGASEPNPLIQESRVFCYNRRTGRFLHWGHCRRQVVRRVVRPRVYCYNRRTGRFLHWGSCRR